MTTPEVPYRIEIAVEVPGTREQVWDALATSTGISSWFLPTDVDEREGGAIVVHMGELDSPGTVTGWDPPSRFAYQEPGWAEISGHPEGVVSPLATEFLVEARSGGTCVVRVVSSAFGTGADWEREVIDEMERYWMPYFEHQLRLYLERFAGQRATTMALSVDVPGRPDDVGAAIERALAVTEVGQAVEVVGLTGTVERHGRPYLVLSVTDPVPGYVSVFATDTQAGTPDEPMASANVQAWLFGDGDGAATYVDEATPAWRSWLAGLAATDAAGPVTR
jgi:uncharacterized protein YndB with AHSA1/START domain